MTFSTTAALELAWAAGFFDGEGSTGSAPKRGADSLGVFASVPQAASTPQRPPAVLFRFHRAVGELGRIGNPYFDRRSRAYLFQWRTDNFEEVQAVTALLWRDLGTVKRAQASRVLSRVAEHYATTRFRRRRPDKPRRLTVSSEGGLHDPGDATIAWAAGLFDAEGSTELHMRRRRSDVFFGLRSKVSQCDANGVPEVLVRFQSAMSCGWIEGPSTGDGYANAYKWAAGATETLTCLGKLWPFLGSTKRAQAMAVIAGLERSPVRRRHPWRSAAQAFAAQHSVEETAAPYRSTSAA